MRSLPAFVLIAVAVAGCGAEAPVLEGPEADAALDAGAGARPDAQEPGEDAGRPSSDAGLPGEDAGGEAEDAGSADASEPPGPDASAPDTGPIGAALYPADRTLSPITSEIAENLRAISARAAAAKPDVFAKVGASNTVNSNFLHCFAGSSVDLAGRDELAPTIAHFKAGDAAGTSPFTRVSKAATVGWSAGAALAGDPSALDQEIAAIAPSLAVVLFGTNDIQSRDVFRYGANMLELTDQLVGQGIIPLLTSVPPRDDSADADLWVPRYSAIVRAIAQARRVPFLDLERELRQLPDHGIGPDGLHLTTYNPAGAPRGCHFSADGLRFGFNRRNLITLQTLHRVRAALGGAPAPDPAAPRLQGLGTAADPYRIAALPFGDRRDTATDGESLIDRYSGCSATQDESGRELYYRLDLSTSKTIRAMVFARSGVDVDLHLLAGQAAAGACVERNDRLIVRTLAAGTWYFALDTFVSGGVAKPGEYLFVVLED